MGAARSGIDSGSGTALYLSRFVHPHAHSNYFSL
ncbi:hypothetical protein CTA1_2253 [Colletotrichum tanaceti]|uniref:Uncharacterized protein n=1 Tax=Colletotrichum tanaceti TaxID=1306861 RepID=A0A4V6DHN3_9PEZI|nr:hypothetical protein CTA1_2253 [Colletotrichum tanaceti]